MRRDSAVRLGSLAIIVALGLASAADAQSEPLASQEFNDNPELRCDVLQESARAAARCS